MNRPKYTKEIIIFLLITLDAVLLTTISEANTAPTQGIPYITPKPAYNSTDLTCNYNATTDDDADNLQNITIWKRNGLTLPLLYMPFEGGSNGSQTYDYATNTWIPVFKGSNGNYNNSMRMGGGYKFNGSDSPAFKYTINYSNFYNISGNFSICIDYKAIKQQSGTDAVTPGCLISKRDFGNNRRSWLLTYNINATLRFQLSTNGVTTSDSFDSHLIMANNTWYYVCVTANVTHMTFYINGTQTDQKPRLNASDPFHTNVPLVWGNQFASGVLGSNWLQGQIDYTAIYNYTISESQINYDYLSILNGQSPTQIKNPLISNDSYTCTTTPNDGTTDGISLTSNPIIIDDTTDILPPLWSNIQNNANANTTTRSTVTITAFLQDETQLKQAKFATNTSGTLTNQTTTQLNIQNTTITTTLQIGQSPGTYICTQYWLQDIGNNINQTDLSCFTVQESTTIDNEIALIGLTLIFTYLILYRKNHLFGNLAYMSIGLATIWATTANTLQTAGIVILFGGIANGIYDLITPKK